MLRKFLLVSSLTLIALAPLSSAEDESASERYASTVRAESVTILDTQGVTTQASGFGKLFSMQCLNGFRGDSDVQIPFERVRSLRTRPVVDNRMPVDLVLTGGEKLSIVVDRTEYEANYGGNADFGYFRIQLEKIREMTFQRPEKKGEGLGLRCPHGHIYYNDTWKFCPYDGGPLTPVRSE